jgi:hypothetical protein
MSRQALLVGLSYHHTKPKYHSLNGLRDYAASFRNVLVEEAGYKFENVKLVSDALQGPINHFIILQHLRKMIITSKSGDELTFFFSGHGGFDGSVTHVLIILHLLGIGMFGFQFLLKFY